MPVVEEWVTKEDMAEQVKKAKLHRKSKLGTFTRKHKHLQTLIDNEAEREVLEKQYNELSEVLKEIEKAHLDLCMLLEEDDEEANESYLDDPSDRLALIHVSITKAVTKANTTAAAAIKVADEEKEFQGKLANFKASIESFGNPSANLSQLSREKNISCVDMRSEIGKIEATMAKLLVAKEKLVTLNPSADLVAVNEQFELLTRLQSVRRRILLHLLPLQILVGVTDVRALVQQNGKQSCYRSSAEKRRLHFCNIQFGKSSGLVTFLNTRSSIVRQCSSITWTLRQKSKS